MIIQIKYWQFLLREFDKPDKQIEVLDSVPALQEAFLQAYNNLHIIRCSVCPIRSFFTMHFLLCT